MSRLSGRIATGKELPPFRWPRAVIFDLDGTLVDSAPDIAMSLNSVLEPLGCKSLTVDDTKPLIGGGALRAIVRACELRGVLLSGDEKAAALDRFMRTYAAISGEGRGLYPGAHELLGELKAEGRGLALCTNKVASIARVALGALGIAHYFDVVIGAENGQRLKPHPDPLLRALAPLGVGPTDAVMVGDTTSDIDAARSAGIAAIVMAYGYSAIRVDKLGADALADRLSDIPALIADLRRSCAHSRSQQPMSS
jgi:phosphoglycolate phosphatase